MAFPCPYTVRESRRARHVRLTLSAQDGLVVVVPAGFDRRRIPAIVEQKRVWIEKTWARIELARGTPGPTGQLDKLADLSLPQHIALAAIGEDWSVEYQATAAPWVAAAERPGRRLLVYGDTRDATACAGALKRWLQRKARAELEPWLRRLADERGFRISHVSIRAQKTRWGSASRRGAISLNLGLLFLPAGLARYVMIHELCHTVQLNHSKRFWALVQAHEPACQAARRELRAAWRHVPAWLAPNA